MKGKKVKIYLLSGDYKSCIWSKSFRYFRYVGSRNKMFNGKKQKCIYGAESESTKRSHETEEEYTRVTTRPQKGW